MSPERPRLALRLGVTGHRAERLAALATAARLEAPDYERQIGETLASVLRGVEAACTEIAASPELRFADNPPLISVLAGAAFGVDQLAASVVAQNFASPASSPNGETAPATQWRIETLLPAPLTLTAEAAWHDHGFAPGASAEAEPGPAYGAVWRDFLARCQSVTTLPATWRPGAKNERRPAAPVLDHLPPFAPAQRVTGDYRLSYVAAASFELQQIDLLIAVWDGKASRGPGGVADIVTHAHAAGIPVVVIDATDLDRPPSMLRSIETGPDRNDIVGWSPDMLEAVTESADCRDDAIGDAILALLALRRETAREEGGHIHPVLTIDDFLDEGGKRRRPSHAYAHFVRLLGGRRAARNGTGDHGGGRSDASWAAWGDALRDEAGLGHDIQTILRGRYATASALANVYASRYRSTFIAAFVFGALAGGIAVLGQALEHIQAYWLKPALIAGELMAIGAVMLLILTGRRRKYHAKYVEYRTLAESLCSLRFLSPFGLALSFRQAAAADRWTDWYVHGTARELGLPNQELGPNYQRRLLKVVREQEIAPQIAYHEENARLMQRVEHRIHLVGNVLFFSVFSALALMLAIWAGEPHGWVQVIGKPILTFIAAFFPTVGAALAGIRFMADFDGRAIRSRDMADALRDLAERTDEGEAVQDFATTVAILRDLAATLSADVKYFHAIYSRRELTLPG